MAQDQSVVSALEVCNIMCRIYWPLLKVQVKDSLQHEEIALTDTKYKLRVSEISLDKTQIEIVDFLSISTKSQNDVLVPKKVLTSQNPFINWTPQDVSRWIGTLGNGDQWDKYELSIAQSNVSGINLTTLTLPELEEMNILSEHAKVILRARDKILGLYDNPLVNEEERWSKAHEFDINGMLKSIKFVANEYKFQFPMETWSVSTLNDWTNQIANTSDDVNWKKFIDIMFEQMIDGKVFKTINPNVLIQYGMNEAYAIAIIKTRDEFLKINIKNHDVDTHKFHHFHKSHKEEHLQQLHSNKLDYEVGIFALTIRVFGPLELRMTLLSNEELIPDCSVHVKSIDITTRLHIELDVVRNVVKLSFLEKPKIKTDLDVKLKLGITLPLIGEDLWLPTIAETMLGKRDQKNPIVIRMDN